MPLYSVYYRGQLSIDNILHWSVVFLHMFNFVSPYVPPGRSLIPMDEFFLVLMRLRLNLMLVDLSVRFKISVSLVNKIISKWVVLYERLKFLISWPPREIVQQNMPPLQGAISKLQLHHRLFRNIY